MTRRLLPAEQSRVALAVVLPSVDLTRVIVQSWATAGGETDDWTAEAYAVCADPLPRAQVIRTTDGSDDRSRHQQRTPGQVEAGEQLDAGVVVVVVDQRRRD